MVSIQRQPQRTSTSVGTATPEQYGIEAFKGSMPIFETLKDEQRLKILVQLIKHGSMSVGQLIDESELSPPAVSHHLKLLLQVQIVSYKKQGTKRIYKPELTRAAAELQRLVDAMTEGQACVDAMHAQRMKEENNG